MKIRLLIFVLCISASAFAQEKKIALVTFYCDKKIGGTGMSTVGESLVNDPNFNMKPALNKAYEKFVNDFAKDFPFKLMDKSAITSNADYKVYDSKFLMDTTKGFNKAMGIQYAVVDEMIWACPAGTLVKDANRDELNLIKMFPDADGVLFVYLDYEIEPRMAGMAAGMTAYINMALFNKNGEKVFRIREFGKSGKKVPAIAGVPVMKTEKILPLCEDANEKLFEELDGKLAKIVKKSAKI